MKKEEYKISPHIIDWQSNDSFEEIIEETGIDFNEEIEIESKGACPCCGFITIPNNRDALAYICPVCFWEIDLFINSEEEPSDQNNGLTILEARKNYKEFGAVLKRLKKNCRAPKEDEKPWKDFNNKNKQKDKV